MESVVMLCKAGLSTDISDFIRKRINMRLFLALILYNIEEK